MVCRVTAGRWCKSCCWLLLWVMAENWKEQTDTKARDWLLRLKHREHFPQSDLSSMNAELFFRFREKLLLWCVWTLFLKDVQAIPERARTVIPSRLRTKRGNSTRYHLCNKAKNSYPKTTTVGNWCASIKNEFRSHLWISGTQFKAHLQCTRVQVGMAQLLPFGKYCGRKQTVQLQRG